MRVLLRQLRLYQQKLGRTHQVPLIQRVQKVPEKAVRGGQGRLGYTEASGGRGWARAAGARNKQP